MAALVNWKKRHPRYEEYPGYMSEMAEKPLIFSGVMRNHPHYPQDTEVTITNIEGFCPREFTFVDSYGVLIRLVDPHPNYAMEFPNWYHAMEMNVKKRKFVFSPEFAGKFYQEVA